jgi:signal transduction histidine kinase
MIDIEAFDGRHRILENAASPLRDAGGIIVGAVVVNQDVTDAERAREEVARRARQQEAVAQLSLCALRGDEMQRLFEQAAALVMSTLGVEYGFVAEWVPAKEEMVVRATAGPWNEEVVRRITVRTLPGLMAWFYMRSELPVVVADLPHETRFAPCEMLLEHGVKSGIAVPIGGKDRPFGVLEGNTTRLRTFAEDEVSFVWSVANVLATCIEQRRAAHELEEKREQLRALSGKLIAAQEAERRAVARELHDDFGQVLTAIKLNLMRNERDTAGSISLVDGAIARMRDLAHDLRPPMLDELGLSASLRWYVEREARRAGLEYQFADAPPGVRPSPGVEVTCFRVAQEAVTNVIRHAHARRIEVELRVAGGALELEVRDDGRGFDVGEAQRRATRGGSQGLLSMQERVALAEGSLEIDSAPGRGAAVRARFPLGGVR